MRTIMKWRSSVALKEFPGWKKEYILNRSTRHNFYHSNVVITRSVLYIGSTVYQ